MDASPALVDSVIVIFPQDGNPVSWRLKHGDDEVSYFVDWWNLLSRESGWSSSTSLDKIFSERCPWPASNCIQSCWRGLEWRQVVKWGSERVENRMCLCLMSVSVRCSLMDPQPRGYLWWWRQDRVWADDFAGRWTELLQHPGMKRRTDLCRALKVFLEKKENVMQMNWWTVEEFHGRGLGRGSVNGRVHQFWH